MRDEKRKKNNLMKTDENGKILIMIEIFIRFLSVTRHVSVPSLLLTPYLAAVGGRQQHLVAQLRGEIGRGARVIQRVAFERVDG